MTIAEKLTTIAENQPRVFDAGKQAGRDAEWNDFWDEFQSKGTKGSYVQTFCGSVWTIKNFKPKYDLRPIASGYCMFNQCWSESLANLEEVLGNLGIKLDISKCTYLTSMFSKSYITHLPKLELLSTDATTNMFQDCKKLVSIREFVLKDTGTNEFSNTFSGCTALTDIVVSGVIGNNISFKDSPLSKVSTTSVVTHLSNSTSGKTLTLKATAVNTAFETSTGANDGSTSAEWQALIATKSNWTISLV